jgi:hypothetical protein
MNTQSIRKLLLVAVVVAVLLVAFGLVNKPGTPANGENVFSLRAPPFVGVARAEAVSSASIIEDEAGISAYFNASTSINLNAVRGVFRTIEVETADYIIGSVPVPNYGEEWDVHVYVHRDGWILAYYLKEDPVGKIFDWIAYHNSGRTNLSTKLENTLALVASADGLPFSTATYYDFRYPNATHLMLIVEWVYSGTDSFQIKLPGSFGYYERSWSLGKDRGEAKYNLDGATIAYHHEAWNVWQISQGMLTAPQLVPDQFHWIEVWQSTLGLGYYGYAYGGLALVYRVPG